MFNTPRIIACMAAATALFAQEPVEPRVTFDAEGHLTFALSSLTKVTNQRVGEGVGLGVTLPMPFDKRECEGIRLGLSAQSFPGAFRTSAKTSLKLYQFTADIKFPSWWPTTSWFLGFSANRYQASNSGTETWVKNPASSSYMTPVDSFLVRPQEAKGVKAGIRAGFEFRWNAHLSAQLVFQQTEMTQRKMELMPEFNRYSESYAVNPSWIETGVRYTF